VQHVRGKRAVVGDGGELHRCLYVTK
jgi:hypothetical protein